MQQVIRRVWVNGGYDEVGDGVVMNRIMVKERGECMQREGREEMGSTVVLMTKNICRT